MAKLDPHVAAHLEWLGFVQPVGLVVSAPALVRAGAILQRADTEGQRLLRDCAEDHGTGEPGDADVVLPDFRDFARSVLGWSFSPKGYAGVDGNPVPGELQVVLSDFDATLAPDIAVRERDSGDGEPDWQLLVSELGRGVDLDKSLDGTDKLDASPHSRMERLLREKEIPAGLLYNGTELRLISAPRGESSGWITFKVSEMVQTAGRPIATAMRLLLSEPRLLTLPKDQRLAALLRSSREFQNEVSEKLAEQVLHALYELQRGFQAAQDASDGELLRRSLAEDPDEVYRALLTTILRMVFLLYAEERDMLPKDETFTRFYSLSGLYERLREDDAHFPDTMNQRYGAWAQLLVLFRMVFDGADTGEERLPARHGELFDPDRYPFLEGRGEGARQVGEGIDPPRVPDGTIYRALEQLLVLDAERISYRALDVEQIGSVYETMMGFILQRATGPSVAVRSQKRHGAPTTIDLSELLAEAPGKRAKWVQDRAARKLTARVSGPLKEASTVGELHAALAPVLDKAATPDLVPPDAMVLQPSEERRRSGSHYTPRALTQPIVRKALEPILEELRDGAFPPQPEQILELKVCDPAMGSGAFLVEACRQLAELLVDSWKTHGGRPDLPGDEDEDTFARRLIAQRCLYGVDRNPVAVDLAKMALWLVTLAREHAFTFLDHSLRSGDSLVGLSTRQIDAFHWDEKAPGFEAVRVRGQLEKVAELRREIRRAGEDISDFELRDLWDRAQLELARLRFYGDLVVTAFFAGKKAKDREATRQRFATAVADGRTDELRPLVEEKRTASPPLVPFHWEIEFPEVFDRNGFDVIIGNPPFMKGGAISTTLGRQYLDWLKQQHPETHGNGDLVAHFFRRGFRLIRPHGTLGLIATNTIGQGDTRHTGLAWICKHDGIIYSARKRLRWPGLAAVVVSVVHLIKGTFSGTRTLDNREVNLITAFLFHRGGSNDPPRLASNRGLGFRGTTVYGMGFTFDDTRGDAATPLLRMSQLMDAGAADPDVVRPYIGGEEVNSDPQHAHHRYVIYLGSRSEAECRERWPELMAILEAKVKPERLRLPDNPDGRRRKQYWWQFGRDTPGLLAATGHLPRVVVASRVGQHLAFAFVPSRMIFADSLVVFAFGSFAAFSAVQARVHEVWARFFGSSMKDDLRYTPSDCFETFPFPEDWTSRPELEAPGQAYYEFRADLMVRNDEGLTKTYNRFHDPEGSDPEIERLRELHAEMDRAVLDSYGWSDVATDCEFLLDYEAEEDESSGRKRKPWRYRWPDEVRDEVLGRLIELNAGRAADEKRRGSEGGGPSTPSKAGGKAKAAAPVQSEGLF